MSAMTDLGMSHATIVTLEHEETLTEGDKHIEVVPAWSFVF
jgi:hypothetical protein